MNGEERKHDGSAYLIPGGILRSGGPQLDDVFEARRIVKSKPRGS